MVDVLRRRQPLDAVVAVAAVVGRARHPMQVRHLMHNGALLVLRVALVRVSLLREERRAVYDKVLRRQRVRNGTPRARIVHVAAVVPCVARVGAAALVCHAVEHPRHRVPDVVARRLEVLLQLARVVLRRPPRPSRQRVTVPDRRLCHRPVVALAIVLHYRALRLGLERLVHAGRLSPVDFAAQRVAAVRQDPHNPGRVELGVRESTLGHDFVVAAVTEVVQLGRVKVHLYGFASLDNPESVFGQIYGGNGQAKTVKRDFRACG